MNNETSSFGDAPHSQPAPTEPQRTVKTGSAPKLPMPPVAPPKRGVEAPKTPTKAPALPLKTPIKAPGGIKPARGR